jgi:GNAT superfamily N-acetyltransferase
MDISVATRPVQPDDEERFVRLWPRLSKETRYRRFHAPLHSLPRSALRRLVQVDHDDREAVVALVGGEVVGVARYDRSPADRTAAEFAVVVEDAWQNMGIGRQLLTELTALAARRGVRVLTATVQVDNDRMVWLIRRLLPRARLVEEDGVFTVESPIGPADDTGPAALALAGAGSAGRIA